MHFKWYTSVACIRQASKVCCHWAISMRVNIQFMLMRCICSCLCVLQLVCVWGWSDRNIHMHTVCACACAWVCETEGGQPDGWLRETEAEGRFIKHNIGRRDREKEERMDGGEWGGDRVVGHKGREGPQHADREGVLKRRWEIVTFISLSTLRQQMIGWLWLILWLGLNMALSVAPGEWLNFDIAQYYN